MMHDASSGLGLTAGIAMGQAGVCVNVQRGNAHVREGPGYCPCNITVSW